jgi:hypothetical protein
VRVSPPLEWPARRARSRHAAHSAGPCEAVGQAGKERRWWAPQQASIATAHAGTFRWLTKRDRRHRPIA